MARKRSVEEEWRDVLTGEAAGLKRVRWVMSRIPSEPRCKFCAAPFGRPGSAVMRITGFGASGLNRRLCGACIRSLRKKPGGAEVELSFLFADVRGSTALAEHMSAHEFSQLMARF